MINSTYLGISAQLALQRRLDTIANNVANAATAGFRGEQIRYASVASHRAQPDASFASIGQPYLNRQTGEVVSTGNPLDVAVDGDAWLSVMTPQGPALSRDGRMQVSATGELLSITGHPVLDAAGSPIRLDPAAGTPSIGRDGLITQGSRRAGSLGLFIVDPSANLSRGLDSTVVSDVPPEPVTDQPQVGVRQGFVERSNVNPVVEMSRLILDQRTFEAVSTVLSENEQTRQDAIRALGSSG